MRITEYQGPREFRANIECTDHNRNTWYYPNRRVAIKDIDGRTRCILRISLTPTVDVHLVEMDDAWECQHGYQWKISFADTGEELTP